MSYHERAVQTIVEKAEELRADARKLMILRSVDANEAGRFLSWLADYMVEYATEEPEE